MQLGAGPGRWFEEDIGAFARAESPIDVALVRDPDVVPEGFMVPTGRSIPCDAALGGDVEIDIAPDPDVEVRKCLTVEESEDR